MKSREHTYMLRLGEVLLKGRNQEFYIEDLLKIVRPRIERIGCRVEKGHKRLLVHGEAPLDAVCEAMATVFGVVGISPIWRVPRDIEAICQRARELMMPHRSSGKTFAIKARRSVKQFPLNSIEIQQRVAGDLLREGLDLAVDLKNPDLRLQIVVDPKQVWMHLETRPGLGGLPVRKRDTGLLLLSGGIDSPVAGHLMQKRGIWLRAVYFDTPPYTLAAAREKAVDLAQVLAEYQNALELHVVDFTRVMQAIRASCREDGMVVLARRFMMRIATALMTQTRSKGLITGESLGQVASQSIENIGTIGRVTEAPVLRPLIGFDKQEIIEIARRLGTYAISNRPGEDCCGLFSPERPMTKARVYEMEEEETALDIETLVSGALEATETMTLHPEYRRHPNPEPVVTDQTGGE